MTGWRCGWALGPARGRSARATRSRATRRRTSARSRRRPCVAALTGPQDCVTDDARRVPAAARPAAARGSPPIRGIALREAGRRVLPVRRRLGAAVARRHPHDRPTSPGAARRGARRADAGRGVRRAGFLRISYATSMERLEEGAKRILAFVAALDAAGKTPAASRVGGPRSSTVRAATGVVSGGAWRARLQARHVHLPPSSSPPSPPSSAPTGPATRPTSARVRHRRAEEGARRPTSSCCPGTTAEVAAVARAVHGAPRAARAARRRHRLHRRRGADRAAASCCRSSG